MIMLDFFLAQKKCVKRKHVEICKKDLMFFLAFLGIDICVSYCVSTFLLLAPDRNTESHPPSKTQGKVPEAVPKAKAKAKAQQTVPGFLVFL